MKRTLTALGTAIGLTLLMAAAAFAWQSRIEGRPVSLEAGGTSGVYFWHDPDGGLYLRTTDPENVEHWYTGQIATDGTIRDLDRSRLEPGQGDMATVDPTHHLITFRFHTFSGLDGIEYFIDGGSYQTVDLQRDGVDLPIDNIFLGAYSVHPDNNPFKVCRDANTCY